MEVKKYLNPVDRDTYIFIDVSNIRSSCLKTLGLKVDFLKLLAYFQKKYPNLKDAYYYEGIAKGDTEKQAEFDKLAKKGYIICSLERKVYIEPAMHKNIKCRKCGTERRVQVMKKIVKMKSNVDVYLATDLLKQAYLTKKPITIVLVACDGDYAEMIKSALMTNDNVHISVLATPVVKPIKLPGGKIKDVNSCSTRLQELRGQFQGFNLLNIQGIKDLIKQK